MTQQKAREADILKKAARSIAKKKVGSPKKANSPKKAKSPKKAESPKKAKSPVNFSRSPKKAITPNKGKSPAKRFLSPEKANHLKEDEVQGIESHWGGELLIDDDGPYPDPDTPLEFSVRLVDGSLITKFIYDMWHEHPKHIKAYVQEKNLQDHPHWNPPTFAGVVDWVKILAHTSDFKWLTVLGDNGHVEKNVAAKTFRKDNSKLLTAYKRKHSTK